MATNQPSPAGEVVWDVMIVGGGPAGLAAALMLGRYRRRTLVFDDGRPRNGAAVAVHGVPGLAGIGPWELRQKTWSEIAAYPDVARREASVVRAYREPGGPFVVETHDGETARGRRLLLATGTEDICPTDVEDFDAYYGRWIHHCPDCDGYQATGRKIGLICWDDLAAPYAMEFLNWTNQITILANGHAETIPADHRGRLGGWGIPVEPRPLARFEGEDGRLTGVRLKDGSVFSCEVAYFCLGQHPRNALAKQLGCTLTANGHIEQDNRQRTSVSDVYAAGDIAPPDETVAVALAEGQIAAITINRSLYGTERWMG